MHTVTVTDGHTEYEFPLGKNYGYRRAEGAVTLAGAVSSVLPFEIEFDLNGDGTWTLRHVRTLPTCESGYNPYLRFVLGLEQSKPTPQQQATMARWMLDAKSRPFGCMSGPSSPVARWCFAGLNREEVGQMAETDSVPYFA